MQDVLNLAQQIAGQLGYVDGVDAVALGGEWARGEGNLDADIKLVIYYRETSRPALSALREVALRLNRSHDPEAVTDFWAQGSVVNGGARLWVEGRRVDWQYRDLDQVTRAVEQARNGVFTAHYQAGYPHGFFSHYLVADVAGAHLLYDPVGTLGHLKAQTNPYPPMLRDSIVHTFLQEADVALFAAQRAASDSDVFLAVGHLYRSAACLVQVVFAHNERYLLSESGAMRAIGNLPEKPQRFSTVLGEVLSRPGSTGEELYESIDRLRALVSEMQIAYMR